MLFSRLDVSIDLGRAEDILAELGHDLELRPGPLPARQVFAHAAVALARSDLARSGGVPWLLTRRDESRGAPATWHLGDKFGTHRGFAALCYVVRATHTQTTPHRT